MVVHTFNSSTQEAEADVSLQFETSLVYIESSRIAWAIERDPVSQRAAFF